MRSDTVQVLIAGGGWRVSRFVVPALVSVGISPDRITILRRSLSAHASGPLNAIKAVDRVEDLPSQAFDITINCVTAASLVETQQALVRRCSGAVHFCDTPIWGRGEDMAALLHLSRIQIYALEDWPYMPNLEHLMSTAGAEAGVRQLSIEHFGIAGHFLSLVRVLHQGTRFRAPVEVRKDLIVARPRSGLALMFRTPKLFGIAKASLSTEQLLVEDFHEVETVPHDNAEILYRVIDDGLVRYFQGSSELGRFRFDPAALAGFAPWSDRKNVHELDKCVALTRMFRAALDGTHEPGYRYLASARDALLARRLMSVAR